VGCRKRKKEIKFPFYDLRDLGKIEKEFERYSIGNLRWNFAIDLCTPNTKQNSNQNQLKNTSILLQGILYECNKLLGSSPKFD
jgi:hypothetical protein